MGSITMEVLKSRDRGRRTGSTFTESLNEILGMENLDKKETQLYGFAISCSYIDEEWNKAFANLAIKVQCFT
jgi:hypothetical protein